MNLRFTARRFIQVFAIAFATLVAVYILRGQPAREAARDAALWSLISASIFAASAVYYRKTNRHCDLCVDSSDQPSKPLAKNSAQSPQ